MQIQLNALCESVNSQANLIPGEMTIVPGVVAKTLLSCVPIIGGFGVACYDRSEYNDLREKALNLKKGVTDLSTQVVAFGNNVSVHSNALANRIEDNTLNAMSQQEIDAMPNTSMRLLAIKVKDKVAAFEALIANKDNELTNVGNINQNLVVANQNLILAQQNVNIVNQNLIAENQHVNADNRNLRATNQNLTTENQNLTATNQNLTVENQNWHTANQTLNTAYQSLHTAYQNSNEDKQKLNSKVNSLNGKVDFLNFKLDRRDAVIRRQNATIAKLNRQVTRLNAENAQLNDENAQLNDEKAVLMQLLRDNTAAINQLRMEVTKVNNLFEQTKQELNQTKAESKASTLHLEKQIESLQEEVSLLKGYEVINSNNNTN